MRKTAILTSFLCKVAERMILNRMYITTDDAQVGVRKLRNTMDQVVAFTEQVKDSFHLKKYPFAVLVDLKAVEDTVSRDMLLHKTVA